MSYRQFDNPNALPLRVTLFRLLNADPDAVTRIEKVEKIDPVTKLPTGEMHEYIWIQSEILTDQQIENGLAMPVTQAETNAIARFMASKTAIANIPNWATWTEAQALTWIDANISQPLASPIPANPMTVQQIRGVLVALVAIMVTMTQVLVALVRLAVAFRDNIKPEQ